MSTRSNIAIRLREADRNKVFQTPWEELVEPKGHVFLYVYCHNDGYPEGVGADLHDMFDGADYDEALEYILMGDRSTTDLTYWDWRRERCAPDPADTEEEMYQNDYLYIIEEGDDGKMRVRMYGDDDDEVDEDHIRIFVDDWYDDNGSDYDEDEISEMLDDCCEAVDCNFGDDIADDFMSVIDEVLRRRWEEDHE